MNNQNDNLRIELGKEADRIREDAEYSAKGHFEAARGWGKCTMCLGIPATIGAALAGVSAVAEYGTLSAGIAVIVAILSGLLTFLRPSERSSRHLKAGNDYNALRNDARMFANIKIKSPAPTAELEKELVSLSQRRNTLNADSPQSPRWAYERAKEGIERGEATHSVDKQD